MSRIDNLVLTDQTRNLAFNSNSFSTLKSITFQIYTRLWAIASAVCCPGIQSPSSGWYSWNIVLTGLSTSGLTVSPFPKQQSECCVKIEVKACSCSMQTRGMICVLIQSKSPIAVPTWHGSPLPISPLSSMNFQKVPVSAVSYAWNTHSQRSKQMAPSSLCILNFPSWQYHPTDPEMLNSPPPWTLLIHPLSLDIFSWTFTIFHIDFLICLIYHVSPLVKYAQL